MQTHAGWHYLIFALPLGFGVLLTLTGSLGLGSAEAELDAELDADGEATPAGEGGGSGSALGGLLALLGIGRVPLNVVLLSLCFLFGGMGSATLLAEQGALGAAGIYVALAVASLSALLGTSFLARIVARLLPSVETYANTPEQLVGTTGTVEVRVSPSFGVVTVLAEDGALHRLHCVSAESDLAKGTEVLLVDFDSERHRYEVVSCPLSLKAGRP